VRYANRTEATRLSIWVRKDIMGSNPIRTTTKSKMSKNKIEKKKLKLQERIKFLEDEMIESLTKKTSDTREINVPLQQRKIQELKIELSKM